MSLVTRSFLPLHLAALEYARDQIGVREESENWGTEVKDYLAAAGIWVPAPWCAAFVNWCAESAARLLGLSSPLEEVVLQAYVQSYFEWAQDGERLISAEEAGPGDLFLLWFPRLGRYGHIGWVDEVREHHGDYLTIEGNTNAAGAREGLYVMERIRPITRAVKFMRWS